MADFTALYSEDATQDEHVAAIQAGIDSGMIWRLEGSMGRTAMAMIEEGLCILGPEPSSDYWGNRIPSRFEVQPGTKGSIEYATERQEQL